VSGGFAATFRSLRVMNYRIWAAGAVVSNIGTWMQRTAQDWIVLTQLTDNDAVAVGVTMALQFGPQLLLLPVTGYAADRFDKRKLLMLTQASMGLLALGLGLLTVTGAVQLWHVWLFALLLGCAAAFDAPVRQTFVTSLVEREDLSNAVALNSTSFQMARLVGPAVAGFLTVIVGAGWVFLINAASFAAVLLSLRYIHPQEPDEQRHVGRGPGALVEGFRYVWTRKDLLIIFVTVFIIGTFGLNFPLYASTMAVAFGQGAGEYGMLSGALAVGSIIGALLAARRERPRASLLLFSSALFGLGLGLAAVMPSYLLFAIMLPLVGAASQTFMTAANGIVQLSSEPAVRGRVMALYMAIFMGGTPIGAPIVGWVADSFGPRWGIAVGAAAGFAAALVGVGYLVVRQGVRVRRSPDSRLGLVLRMERAEATSPQPR